MTKHILGAALAAGLAVAGGASAQTVGIATSNPGSLYHNIGTAIANAANQAGLNTTIQPATSPNQFIPLINAGGIEFGIANLQEVNYAFEGKAWFEGQPRRTCGWWRCSMPLKEAIFVRADSDIKTDRRPEGQADGRRLYRAEHDPAAAGRDLCDRRPDPRRHDPGQRAVASSRAPMPSFPATRSASSLPTARQGARGRRGRRRPARAAGRRCVGRRAGGGTRALADRLFHRR